MKNVLEAILALIQLALPALQASGAGGSKVLSEVVQALVVFVPLVVQEAEDLVPMVRNIIAALRSSSGITTADLQALTMLDAECDASFDNAVGDKIGPMP